MLDRETLKLTIFFRPSAISPANMPRPESTPHHNKLSCPSIELRIAHTTTKMKSEDLSKLAASLASPDFKTIEPHLLALDKHLTLRTFVEGYSLSQVDSDVWVAIRTNRVAAAALKRGTLVNAGRWFNYIEQTHPEIQQEIKAQDEAEKARKATLSKAGASYNKALQDTEKGVVTRFPPEPS